MGMINRTLSKRVQKLEARLIPTDEPMVIHIKYVSPDGTVEDGPRITCGGSPPTPTSHPIDSESY
jgi:hypothetical protein